MIILYLLAGALAVLLAYILFLFFCAMLVNPKREYETHSTFYRALLNSATAAACRIMRLKIHVTGLEKLPDSKRILFVCNHRSNFDSIVTWYALRQWIPAFISKESNFRIPVFGRIIRKCCFMAIDRENPRNAIQTIRKAADLLDREETSVAIYPEGTRSKSGVLLPFHNGVFKIAQKAQAPVAVLAISGTEQIHKNFPFHTSHIHLDVVQLLPAEQVVHQKTDETGIAVRTAILRRLKETEQKEET